jgi:Lon protease-like protein
MITTVDTVEIPLFPLGTVLFPDGVLPLKLFEARYLDMAARCMRANAPFGVCLIREGGEVGAPAVPHGVGSIARITGWDMDKPGLLFITTRGGERFRIVEQTTRPDRLLTAHIALLPEPRGVEFIRPRTPIEGRPTIQRAEVEFNWLCSR